MQSIEVIIDPNRSGLIWPNEIAGLVAQIDRIKFDLQHLSYNITLFVTDMVSNEWYNGSRIKELTEKAKNTFCCIVMLLPSSMYGQSGFDNFSNLRVLHCDKLLNNGSLKPEEESYLFKLLDHPTDMVALPIINISELELFGKFLANKRPEIESWPAIFVSGNETSEIPALSILEPIEKATRFTFCGKRTTIALAGLYAAIPLQLPIMEKVQREICPKADRADFADIMLSGLVKYSGAGNSQGDIYDFLPGVRQYLLRQTLTDTQILQVLILTSGYIENLTGGQLNFKELLQTQNQSLVENALKEWANNPELAPFASATKIALSDINLTHYKIP